MLLFYEDEPDAIGCTQRSTTVDISNSPSPTISPLPHYASHAFLPYLHTSQPETASSSSPSPCTAISTAGPLAKQPVFKLHNTSTWTYCGPLLPPAASSLPPSFHTWAVATISSPSTLLSRLLPFLSFLQTFLLEAGVNHYWLTIRATKATNEYDMPRWHLDDNFFDNGPEADGLGFSQHSKSRYWKVATTLLGPTTLFLKNNAKALAILRQTKADEKRKMGHHTCTSIRCLGCSTYADTVRQSLARSLADQTIVSPAYGEVAFFRIGSDEEGAVHSEPKCDTDRIFVNVIPGTEHDLRSLMARWGMTYPRAWCFGVPVGFVVNDETFALGELDGHEPETTIRTNAAISTSSMGANMCEEYGSWLEENGFQFAKTFGHHGTAGT